MDICALKGYAYSPKWHYIEEIRHPKTFSHHNSLLNISPKIYMYYHGSCKVFPWFLEMDIEMMKKKLHVIWQWLFHLISLKRFLLIQKPPYSNVNEKLLAPRNFFWLKMLICRQVKKSVIYKNTQCNDIVI